MCTHTYTQSHAKGFPGGVSGKEPISQCLVPQTVKNLPAMWETWVRFLGWEDPLEVGVATHSSILAWKSLWTEEPSGLQSMGSQRVGHNLATKHSTANAGDTRELGLSLGEEDPLEEGMATHSRFLPGESPWTEEPGGLQSTGLHRVRHDKQLRTRAHQY